MHQEYSQQVLICYKCSSPLSKRVKFANIRSVEFSCETGNSPSESGIASLIYNDGWHIKQPHELWHLSIQRIWMNLNDILKTVESTISQHELSKGPHQYGCCGINGWVTGPNRVCPCGELVGTEFSDCETFHAFVPDLEKTKWELAS